MKNSQLQLGKWAELLAFCLFVCLSGCADSSTPNKPTPDAAKRVLKLRGYDFDEKSFFSAAAAGDVLAVNSFIAAGFNPNVKDAEGATALHLAASHGDVEIVKALVLGGADINQKDNLGYTPVLRAISSKQDAVADLLLPRQNLDLNAQGANGMTVLMRYVWNEREDVVSNLLDRGADVKLQDGEGDTALHGAAQRGNVNITRMLLERGSDPNAKNKLGGTPLMWAGVYGHREVAELLINKGADPKLKDNDGMTAAAWAAKNNRDEVAQWLKDAEKK